MRRSPWVGLVVVLASLTASAMPTQASAAKALLRLSEGGVPVAQGTEVGALLTLRPEGFSGSALQIAGGPLVNEAAVDGFTAYQGGDGTGSWAVHGTVEAIALAADGRAMVSLSGEAIADDETEGTKPVGPPPPSALAVQKWECFYPLPKKLKGTFPTSGAAVVTGTTSAKPSKLCSLPGFRVSFTLELLPEGLAGQPLETSLMR